MHLGNLRVEDDTPGGGSYLGFAPLRKGAARYERSSSWIRVMQVFSVSFVAGFALHERVCGGVLRWRQLSFSFSPCLAPLPREYGILNCEVSEKVQDYFGRCRSFLINHKKKPF